MANTLVLTNFKNYPQATGANCDSMLSAFSSIRAPAGVDLVYSISPLDLHLAGGHRGMHIFSQHVDFNDPGAATGKIIMERLMDSGINGSLLNHSENRISGESIRKTVEKANRLGFTIILCVESPEEAGKYAGLHPSYIAYEPPELIGGDISVSTSKPGIITKVVEICRKHDVPVLVGAGVKNSKDLKKSLELGAEGILLASGIVKSESPESSLTSLISSE